MIFDILEKKIIDAGLGVPGESLFRHFMPAETIVGIMSRSPLTGVQIDPFIEGWHKVDIQIIVRHTDPVLGEKLSTDVCKALFTETLERHPANSERGAVHLNLFYPRTLPISFPRLVGNGLEFSQHFRCVFGIVPNWK